MFDGGYDASAVNGLIRTTLDSVNGYRSAAGDVQSDRFRDIFSQRADEREELVLELQAHVRSLGGEPETDGTSLAGAHRWFMGIKDALVGGDDKAIIDEVERGEDHIKATYDDALADQDLSPDTRIIVEECYASVKIGHDQMRDLKHGLEHAKGRM